MEGFIVVHASDQRILDEIFGPLGPRTFDGGPTTNSPIDGIGLGGYSGGACSAQGAQQEAYPQPPVPPSIRDEQEDYYSTLPTVDSLIGPEDLTSEEYREYYQPESGVTYRINYPVALYRREGGTTHRVVDIYGVVHCVPCGSLHPNTVIRWKNWDRSVPVNW